MPSRRVWLQGRLTDQYRLVRPVAVTLEHDDGEVIASEELFHIHGVGATEAAALAAFRHALAGYRALLSAREATLGEHLRQQLGYLRAVIAPA